MYVAQGTDIPDDVCVIPIEQKVHARALKKIAEWKNEGVNPLETLNVALDMTDSHPDLTEYDVILESAPLSKSYVPTTEQKVVHYPHSPHVGYMTYIGIESVLSTIPGSGLQ